MSRQSFRDVSESAGRWPARRTFRVRHSTCHHVGVAIAGSGSPTVRCRGVPALVGHADAPRGPGPDPGPQRGIAGPGDEPFELRWCRTRGRSRCAANGSNRYPAHDHSVIPTAGTRLVTGSRTFGRASGPDAGNRWSIVLIGMVVWQWSGSAPARNAAQDGIGAPHPGVRKRLAARRHHGSRRRGDGQPRTPTNPGVTGTFRAVSAAARNAGYWCAKGRHAQRGGCGGGRLADPAAARPGRADEGVFDEIFPPLRRSASVCTGRQNAWWAAADRRRCARQARRTAASPVARRGQEATRVTLISNSRPFGAGLPAVPSWLLSRGPR